MQTISFGMSDPGRVRRNNEDAFFCNDEKHVFAVADGLGGLPGGGQASRRAVGLIKKHVTAANSRAPFDLDTLLHDINTTIAETGLEEHPFTGTGTTLTAGQILGDRLYIGHVGDSACYLLRHGQIVKLTTDHTMEQEFIKVMGPDSAESMPRDFPHTLTRCIGQMEDFQVDHYETVVQAGDRLLLCTDGINKVLDDKAIKELLAEGLSPEECSRILVEATIEKGAPDNVTAVVVFLKA